MLARECERSNGFSTHRREGKYTEGSLYFVLYVFVLYFVLCLYFLAPATRDRCGGRKRCGASCLGCTLGTWLCSMSNSIIYHVSCYRFVSQHTYIYHIGPHADVDTDSDSTQQQQPSAPAPAVAQLIPNNTKSSLLYYVLYVLIVLCIVLCIMYFRSLTRRPKANQTQVIGHSKKIHTVLHQRPQHSHVLRAVTSSIQIEPSATAAPARARAQRID
jgi:hypothetical protein